MFLLMPNLTCNSTTPLLKFLSVRPPETSVLCTYKEMVFQTKGPYALIEWS